MKALVILFSLVLGLGSLSAAVAAPVGSADLNTGIKYDPSMPSYQGFISIASGRELYVEFVKAQPKQPTLVLLNGLTYSTRQWDEFVKPLLKQGVGILRYDMYGHGQTLLRYAPVLEKVPFQNQVEDLKQLLMTMKLKGPFNLVGLSYGGGIGIAFANQYPEDVNKLILIAPYTRALEGQDVWIKSQIWATRQIFPFVKYSDEDLYDYYLHQIVYATYPQAEPVVLENPFKLEATFRLVQGIRQYRPVDEASKLPAGKVHLVVSIQDQYIQPAVLEEFWSQVSPAAKMSRLFVYGAEHKLPEAVPNFTASWVYQIATGNPALSGGADFEGFPYKNEVRAKDGSTVKIGF